MTQSNILLPSSLHQPFHGVLFDLDGTIIDSEELHFQAFKQALQEYGYDLDSIRDVTSYRGSFRKMFEMIGQQFHLADNTFEEIYDRKVAITLEAPATTANLVDGVLSYLELLKERGVPTGIVTNSEQAYVDHVLAGYQLNELFDHVVHAEHVDNPKPAPDGYIYGANLLSISPNNILAFENTDAGILAAKAAGMQVIAIRDTDRSGLSTYEQADHAIDDFTDSIIDEVNFYVRN